MFLPGNAADKQKEDEQRKAAYKNIEAWSLSLMPEECRDDALVSVQEVQCGDPQCAPIDTAITVQFPRSVTTSHVNVSRETNVCARLVKKNSLEPYLTFLHLHCIALHPTPLNTVDSRGCLGYRWRRRRSRWKN
jgi:hypothetical protein